MNAESSLRSEFTISSHFLSSCLGLRVLGSKPNQSSRPGNSNTVTTLSYKRLPPRQQKKKKRENLQINRTATVQQYRHSSIEQFSSISTVYSSTIHPPANSPTLNPFTTQGVKSKPMTAIGISASETKASYRLLCLALNRKFCDHEGYETYVPSKTGALGTLKGFLPKLSPVSFTTPAPGIKVFPLAT